MSSGHTTEAAPVGPLVRLIQRYPGLQHFLGQGTGIVSRKFLVPYGAGRSMDGAMTYVDEGVPERFKMGVCVDKYVSAHEGMEWWLMTRLGTAYWVGPNRNSAHWWAEGYEHYQMMLDGWTDDEIDEYEREWGTYVAEDEAQRLSPETVPPDLYTGAYEAASDTDKAEDKADAKILQILLAARARMVATREARLIG